jgi:hypothetical protein
VGLLWAKTSGQQRYTTPCVERQRKHSAIRRCHDKRQLKPDRVLIYLKQWEMKNIRGFPIF